MGVVAGVVVGLVVVDGDAGTTPTTSPTTTWAIGDADRNRNVDVAGRGCSMALCTQLDLLSAPSAQTPRPLADLFSGLRCMTGTRTTWAGGLYGDGPRHGRGHRPGGPRPVVLVVRATTGPGAANHQPHARDPRDTPRDSGAGRPPERFRPRGHRRMLRLRPPRGDGFRGRPRPTPRSACGGATRQDRDTDPRVRPSTTRPVRASAPPAANVPGGGAVSHRACSPLPARWSVRDGQAATRCRRRSRGAEGCDGSVTAGVGPRGGGGRWVFGGGGELGGQLGDGRLEGCGAAERVVPGRGRVVARQRSWCRRRRWGQG